MYRFASGIEHAFSFNFRLWRWLVKTFNHARMATCMNILRVLAHKFHSSNYLSWILKWGVVSSPE